MRKPKEITNITKTPDERFHLMRFFSLGAKSQHTNRERERERERERVRKRSLLGMIDRVDFEEEI
jgi:hypothetical protein